MGHGLYDRDLLREFPGPLALFMIEEFLVRPATGQMPTEDFLPLGPGTEGVAAEETRAPFPNLRDVFPAAFAEAERRASQYRTMPSLR
jgi:hypothetical protein